MLVKIIAFFLNTFSDFQYLDPDSPVENNLSKLASVGMCVDM